LRLAIGELLFDEPAFRVPRYATHVGEGELLVFRGTHEAWEAEQVFALFRRQLTEDALRQVPQQDRAVGRQFAAVRTIRRGNVLIVLTGRDAQLEAVAAELP
jgi:hypothetical protein